MYLLSLAVRVAAGAAVVRPLRLVHSPVPSQSRSSGNCRRMEMEDGHRKRRYLGCLSKKQLLVLSGVAGLGVLLVAIIVPTVLLSRETDPSVPDLSFATDGDMLDFLVQSGTIKDRDGLQATWFHRANSKDEMNRALASEAMVLEADVTLQGYGTPAQKPIPIMAHPPNVTSDNTLDQWLDAVLNTRKGIKLDFKSLASVGLSLDLLLQKNSSRGIHRPVWLNADVLKDPLVPGFIPSINGTQFLELVQEKFPNVTLSLGWMVLGIYNRKMVEGMYALVKDLPQRVTFPIHSLFVRKGWPHISWLLSQSSRFKTTVIQEEFTTTSTNPR
uniref:Protein FAM151A n=1 Tax=Knipowitschia caucasica TaxID=637954 RepID=A0AAV2JSZ0_KNICA